MGQDAATEIHLIGISDLFPNGVLDFAVAHYICSELGFVGAEYARLVFLEEVLERFASEVGSQAVHVPTPNIDILVLEFA